MPIRRAAGTPPQDTTSTAAEGEPDAMSEESPSVEEEQAGSMADEGGEGEAAGDAEPKENGENADEAAGGKKGDEDGKKGLKDGYKLEKAKVKKVKRTIPAWATVSANKKIPVSNFPGSQPKMDEIIIEALKSCEDRSGMSYKSVMKYVVEKYPGLELDRRNFLIKKALKKQLEKGTVKQLKGKGLAGSFSIGKLTTNKPAAKKAAITPGVKAESLGDALPLIITLLCEPKEASYILIRKYVEQHFPHLNIKDKPDLLKSALVKAVDKGIVERITGKGASGTFQLKRSSSKTLKGGTLDDAIVIAITAMNEPKTCSTFTLRKYLVDNNKDSKESRLVANLRKTLTKCKMLGWMEQITGKGFSGTYQLSFPYYPSPAILYPDKVLAPPKRRAETNKRKRADSSSEEEESDEEDEEDDEDDEPPPKRKAQKRPPPRARLPPQKKPKSASPSKAKGKRPAPKKRGAPPAKKAPTPAKKPAPPAKKAASPVKKPSAKLSASKATPVKKAAPAKKPKTPVAKKLNSRGSKRPGSQKSSMEKPAAKKEGNKPSARRSQRGKN